jgi:hypothetical protein
VRRHMMFLPKNTPNALARGWWMDGSPAVGINAAFNSSEMKSTSAPRLTTKLQSTSSNQYNVSR